MHSAWLCISFSKNDKNTKEEKEENRTTGRKNRGVYHFALPRGEPIFDVRWNPPNSQSLVCRPTWLMLATREDWLITSMLGDGDRDVLDLERERERELARVSTTVRWVYFDFLFEDIIVADETEVSMVKGARLWEERLLERD